MMLEILNNIWLGLVLVGLATAIISITAGVSFFDMSNWNGVRWSILAGSFGTMLFFMGWAIPSEPKTEIEMTRPAQAERLFDDCMSSVTNEPKARMQCITVVRNQLNLYEIGMNNDKKRDNQPVGTDNSRELQPAK